MSRTWWRSTRTRPFSSWPANLGHRLTKGYWEQPAPTVWPPPHGYREIRALAADALPGVRYRRHLLFRYSLVWTKPGSAATG